MNTGVVRYGTGAVLAAVAAGLLVSSGLAPAASGAAPAALSGTVQVRPHADLITCGFLTSVRVRGQLMDAGECIGSLGGPARGTETYRAGSLGRAALVSDAKGCLADHHLELREAARNCPIAAVGVVR